MKSLNAARCVKHFSATNVPFPEPPFSSIVFHLSRNDARRVVTSPNYCDPERYETPITQIRETPITQIRSAARPGWATGLDHAFACGFAFDGKMKACLAARERNG